MIIIVEGIDRVGKTTLCRKLSSITNYKIVKKDREQLDAPDVQSFVKTRENALINYGNAIGMIDLANEGLLDNVIFDRFHWTEAIYGYINRECTTSYYFMHRAEKRMKKEKFIVVYVRPTNIDKSSREHGSSLKKHLQMYEDLVAHTRLKCVKCNYNTIDDAIEEIVNILKV